jgi:hypothetical protein
MEVMRHIAVLNLLMLGCILMELVALLDLLMLWAGWRSWLADLASRFGLADLASGLADLTFIRVESVRFHLV